MPKAGKPRKKYKPKRTLVGNIRGGANILAKLSVSNEPLDELTIKKTLLPFKQFIEKLKTGEADSQIFYNACAFHYQYITILEVISRSKINADAETEMLARLQNSVRKDTAINVTIGVFSDISQRYFKTEKWVGKGDEIKHLENIAHDMEEVLRVISWHHFMTAFKESEHVLDSEMYRSRKTKSQPLKKSRPN